MEQTEGRMQRSSSRGRTYSVPPPSKHGRDAVLDGKALARLGADQVAVDDLDLEQHVVQRLEEALVIAKVGGNGRWQRLLHAELRRESSNPSGVRRVLRGRAVGLHGGDGVRAATLSDVRRALRERAVGLCGDGTPWQSWSRALGSRASRPYAPRSRG
eukprot:scaffold71845_cov78-Phaeocystis_antarctica.AAC.1